jgi:hypothetical protein
MTEVSTRRGTAVIGLTAGVVALVGNLLAPRFDGEDVDVYRELADSTRSQVSNVIVLAAVILATAAFVGFTRVGYGGRHAELRYFGRLAATAGGTIAALETGIALFAYRQQAIAFAGADDRNVVSAFWATNAIDHLTGALFAVWTLLLLGLAPLLIAAEQLRERSVSPVVAGLGLVGGLGCAVVGVCLLLTDTPSDLDVPFLVTSLVVTAWIFATSLALWRTPDVATLPT